MDPESRLRRRGTFDSHPDEYVRGRPGYPAEMVRGLVTLAGITPDARILEIGCGPGTLTKDLAPLGCEIVAVELGAQLAAEARKAVRGFPRVRVEVAAFEEWPLPDRSFDVVVAAGCYHWLDPQIRVSRILQALGPDGRVAVVDRHRVVSDRPGLEAGLRECYVRWDPKADPDFRHPAAADISGEISDLKAEPSLTSHEIRRYPGEALFTTERYRDLLRTYSDFNSMETDAQHGLEQCLTSLLDAQYGGVLRMPLLGTLHVARKRRSESASSG